LVVRVFELIITEVPELQRLEEAVAALEREHGEASARVQGLANRVLEARERDLDGEAAALNRGRKPPKPKEPELRSQLDSAQRELEVLERRLTLAGSDRSRYIQEHHAELVRLLAQARDAEGENIAEGASRVLEDLLRYFKCEDDARAMRRLIPEPVQENTGEPERAVAVWGPVGTQTVTGGPRRGDLEGALRYLVSLGGGTVVGEGAEGSDAA
jgi:chromosome segregation ATPase